MPELSHIDPVSAELLVMDYQVAFRAGQPELSPGNSVFSVVETNGMRTASARSSSPTWRCYRQPSSPRRSSPVPYGEHSNVTKRRFT